MIKTVASGLPLPRVLAGNVANLATYENCNNDKVIQSKRISLSKAL